MLGQRGTFLLADAAADQFDTLPTGRCVSVPKGEPKHFLNEFAFASILSENVRCGRGEGFSGEGRPYEGAHAIPRLHNSEGELILRMDIILSSRWLVTSGVVDIMQVALFLAGTCSSAWAVSLNRP